MEARACRSLLPNVNVRGFTSAWSGRRTACVLSLLAICVAAESSANVFINSSGFNPVDLVPIDGQMISGYGFS